MVLRRIRRIDTIQNLKTKDGVKLRVKCIAVTRKIKSSIERIIRKEIERLIKEEVENSPISEFVTKILNDKIKKRVMKEIRKIYPIRNFEIRKTQVL
jgi:small subunit ribosomal protein S3Ae